VRRGLLGRLAPRRLRRVRGESEYRDPRQENLFADVAPLAISLMPLRLGSGIFEFNIEDSDTILAATTVSDNEVRQNLRGDNKENRCPLSVLIMN